MEKPLSIVEQVKSVEILFREGKIASACRLIHCLIDNMAFLSMPPGQLEHTKKDYKTFVDNYILKNLSNSSNVDAADLYSARCGAVHSNTWSGQGRGKTTVKWNYRGFASKCASREDCLESEWHDLADFWVAVVKGIDEWCHARSADDSTIRLRLAHSMEFWSVRPLSDIRR